MVVSPEHARKLEVPADRLRTICESLGGVADRPDQALPPAAAYLGQQRAIEALQFGIGIQRDGFNVFVLGMPGTHRHALAGTLARDHASGRRAPDDWCYVNNFSNPERPLVLRLPPGKGAEFRDDMHAVIDEVRIAIPAVFEDDDYRNQRKAVEAETQTEIEALWESIRAEAERDDIAVLQTPTGYVLAPVSDGKVIDDEEFETLPQEKRDRLHAAVQRLSEELRSRIESLPQLRRKQRERIRALDRDVMAHTVVELFRDLKARYGNIPDVARHLDAVEQNIVENSADFRQTDEPALPFLRRDTTSLLATYEINLVVSNAPDGPAPVIYESNPSYPNLIGKVEHRAELGALLTDFRMIRGGALQRANGGYLILDIHRVLERPFAWDGLKEALFTKQVRIESPADTLGFVGTTAIKPEPVPLSVKIILVGERWLYYLLSRFDKEFGSLFKVAADLEDDMQRSPGNVAALSGLIVDRAGEQDLLPLASSALRRIIEQRARQADDSERLSTHMQSLDDLLLESDYRARGRSAARVEAQDVVAAIRSMQHRSSRVQSRIIDAIERRTLLIDTEGACVGQVNGLSVVDLGGYRFGHPARITATTRIGTGDLIDIEREVELGGAIHSKGVMILSSVLSARFAPETPLSLHGSIVFEQSYGGVDGDSASVAELCALMSSIADVPLRQGIACTGSINQLGRVQAVGGVNEKIEGFFDICSKRGLDGSHGVVIPRDNVKHLMLREDVVDAVRDRRFAVYAVEDIDEAIELLTGEPAGRRDGDGQFPEGTVNQRIEERLLRYAQQRRRFAEVRADGD